jgi:hypothetical protein
MTKRNDFLTELEDYLVDFEGETPLPERVRDALHAELPMTRQVRPRSGRWKGPNMSTSTPSVARWGLVAAGLVVAVGLGAVLLLPARGDVGTADPSPTVAPTTSPTQMPSPSAAAITQTIVGAPYESCPVLRSKTCIVPGTYRLGATVPTGLVDVPAGWWEWDPGPGSVGLLVEHPDAAGGSGWGLTVMQVGEVHRNPCDQAAGTFAPANVDTPAELAAVMATWPGFEATPPEPVDVGGIEGVQVELRSTKGLADCPGAVLWETPVGTLIDGYPMVENGGGSAGTAHPAHFRIIDLDGQLVAIRTMPSALTSPHERKQGIPDDPTRHQADLVVQQAIIDSIRFEEPAP